MSASRSMRRKVARGRRVLTNAVAAAEGRINAYHCPVCRAYIVTVDIHEGTTPMFLSCRSTRGCRGQMYSMGYPPQPWPAEAPKPIPTWEWYTPVGAEAEAVRRDPDAWDHVRRGGLLIRPVSE